MDKSGFARTYGVELFFSTPTPTLPDKSTLLEKLRERCGRIDPLGNTDESKLLAFVYLDHVVSYEDRRMPAQCLVAPSEKPPDVERLEPSLQQTWDWSEARGIVSKCRSTALVTDFLASALDYKTRLAMFHGVLQSVLELTSCLAIHWHASQRLVGPAAYLEARSVAKPDPLFPALNVRLFRVENQSAGETVMDTVGLAALGLPDLQCHFANLDPNDVARVLYNSAYYIFEQGNVIESGHTIQGITQDQRWVCRHEEALVAPERVVIDINPGPPYAAGKRH